MCSLIGSNHGHNAQRVSHVFHDDINRALIAIKTTDAPTLLTTGFRVYANDLGAAHDALCFELGNIPFEGLLFSMWYLPAYPDPCYDKRFQFV